ncbi:DegT/DnrJ/EryC1/StrS family aminotransferase [Patescibacteria group bacterium]
MIPHNKPTIGEEEIRSVGEVIRNHWLVPGTKTKEFENIFCKYIGLPEGRGVALSSGTAALYVALKVLEIGGGDEVIIPTYVCSSLLNAVYMAQAKPVIVDIKEKDFNISLAEIKAKINNRTKAVIVPHMFGVPADTILMREELEIPIIEDCATAIGSRIDEKYLGTLTDIGMFSFYASKVIATGQGGMLVSNNVDHVEKARDYIDFDLGKGKKRGKRPFYPRFNFETTDIQSALGTSQFSKIEMLLDKRKQISEAYQEICNVKGWDFQKPAKDNFYPNYYRFVVKSDNQTINDLQAYLKKHDIETIIPIENWELLHNYLELNKKDFRIAEKVSNETLSLPAYPNLIKEGNLEKIINIIEKF